MNSLLDIPPAPAPLPAAEPRPPRGRRFAATGLTFASLAGFGIAVWYAYNAGMRVGSAGVAPLIRAEAGAYRHRPDRPGGLNPPYQDKFIYDRVAPGQSGATREKIRPAPEEPVQSSAAANGGTPATPAPPVQVAHDKKAKPAKPVMPEPARPEKEAAPEAKVEATEAPPPARATNTLTETQRKEILATVGPYRVQLASLKTVEEAAATWKRLLRGNGDMLRRLDFFVEKVDLGRPKGVYYRVQAGPFETKRKAGRFCAKLRERSVDCIVVDG